MLCVFRSLGGCSGYLGCGCFTQESIDTWVVVVCLVSHLPCCWALQITYKVQFANCVLVLCLFVLLVRVPVRCYGHSIKAIQLHE